MKRTLLLLVMVLGLSSAQAQSYFGVGGTRLTSTAYGSASLVSVQIGGPTAPEFGGLEARVALDTSLRGYFGGGPDVLLFAPLDSVPGQARSLVSFGLHGTAGLEFLAGGIRPFAELQPAAALLDGELVFGLGARAGVNLYF